MDFDFVFLYADKNFVRSFLRERITEMSDKEKEFYTWLGHDPKDVEAYAESLKEITNKDIVNFKVGLLFSMETYLPMVYILKEGAAFEGGKLRLAQNVNFIRKYVELAGGVSYEETLKDVAPFLSLDNDRTYRALLRIAKLWGSMVFLDTIDAEGKPLRLMASISGKISKSGKT